jgi:hypothetical protein
MLSPFLAGEAPDGFPVWEDLMDENSVWLRLHPDFDRNGALARMQLSNEFTSQDPRTGGLQTGKGRGAPPWDGDPPWEHRHAEGGIDEVIDVLSRRECALWIRRIQGLLDKSEVERSSSSSLFCLFCSRRFCSHRTPSPALSTIPVRTRKEILGVSRSISASAKHRGISTTSSPSSSLGSLTSSMWMALGASASV